MAFYFKSTHTSWFCGPGSPLQDILLLEGILAEEIQRKEVLGIGCSNWESFTKAVRFQFIVKGEERVLLTGEPYHQWPLKVQACLSLDDAEETDSPWNTHLFHEVVYVMGSHPVGFHIYYNYQGKVTLVLLFQVIDLFRNLEGQQSCMAQAVWASLSREWAYFAPKAQERVNSHFFFLWKKPPPL